MTMASEDTCSRKCLFVHYLFKVDDHFMSHIFLGLEHRNESMFAVSFFFTENFNG